MRNVGFIVYDPDLAEARRAGVYVTRGGVKLGTPEGCELGDGSVVPLAGIYVLEPDGSVRASADLASEGALTKLRETLGVR